MGEKMRKYRIFSLVCTALIAVLACSVSSCGGGGGGGSSGPSIVASFYYKGPYYDTEAEKVLGSNLTVDSTVYFYTDKTASGTNKYKGNNLEFIEQFKGTYEGDPSKDGEFTYTVTHRTDILTGNIESVSEPPHKRTIINGQFDDRDNPSEPEYIYTRM